MTTYRAEISKDGCGDFYAVIVSIDNDSNVSVIYGYKGRHFKTLKAAERSTDNHMKKYGMKQQ